MIFQARVITGLAAASAYLILTVILFRQNRFREWPDRIVAVYLLLSTIWSVAHAVTVWQGLIPSVPLLGAQIATDMLWIFPTLNLILTVQFLERPGVRGGIILGTAWVVFAALAELNVFGLLDALVRMGLGTSRDTALTVLRIVGWGSLGLSAVALTATDYVRTKRPLHRNRIMFWLLVLALTQVGEGLTLIPPIVLDTEQLGVGVRLAGVGMLVMAFTRYNLPDLRAIARRSTNSLVTIVASGALYLVGFLVFQAVLVSGLDRGLVFITAAAIALTLAVTQRPMSRLIQKLLDRLQYAQHYDPAHALREYSGAISNILDLPLLVTTAVGIINRALEVRRGALLLITEQSDGEADVRVIPGVGEVGLDRFVLSADSPILADLRQGNQPLTQYEIDILPKYRAASIKERTWLQALDMEVYVPIRSQSVLVGVISLGHKASGDLYTSTDFNVLITLGGQTAVALQNARLVTDLKQANASITQLNDELTYANRRLEKLDQAKTDFIEIASHELRTPLTQVRGYADILSDSVREGNPSLPQMVQISQGIGRASQRLEEIITAMLDVSQIDAEALSISRTPLAMVSVLRFATDGYKEALKRRKQALTMSGIEDLPPIQGDFQRLCQAFGNVIGNCIKYTPDGGEIAVTGRTLDGNSYVEVVIADSGIGINPADQELIFEKFYRVGSVELHSSGQTKFKGGGPGLGLPIARGVIQAHGGKIWVESEGQDESRFPGSKFHILLPCASPSVIAEFNAQQAEATLAAPSAAS